MSCADTKKASILLIRKIYILMQNLGPLPNDVCLTMKLFYYDEGTISRSSCFSWYLYIFLLMKQLVSIPNIFRHLNFFIYIYNILVTKFQFHVGIWKNVHFSSDKNTSIGSSASLITKEMKQWDTSFHLPDHTTYKIIIGRGVGGSKHFCILLRECSH